jgi:chromosome segregation and condensation protein ScpB
MGVLINTQKHTGAITKSEIAEYRGLLSDLMMGVLINTHLIDGCPD